MEVQMPEMNTQKATVNPLCNEGLTAGLPITGGGTIEKGPLPTPGSVNQDSSSREISVDVRVVAANPIRSSPVASQLTRPRHLPQAHSCQHVKDVDAPPPTLLRPLT